MKTRTRKTVYLDWAGSAPLRPEALRAMLPFFKKEFGNPSAQHGPGRRARAALERARADVAAFLGAAPGEIVFTSGASEANNLAFTAATRAGRGRHIVVSPLEHSSVIESVNRLKAGGFRVTWLPVGPAGRIKPEAVVAALRPDTVFVSIGLANNEIGTVQPIAAIAAAVREKIPGVLMHTDAAQAAAYLDCHVHTLGVDLLTLSGHKAGAARGIGALFVKRGTTLEHQIVGGQQEGGLRAGTENVAGAVGLAAALAVGARRRLTDSRRVRALSERLIRGVLRVPGARLASHPIERVPHIGSFIIADVSQEDLLMALDQLGVAVSAGSACASGSIEPSHVLTALGFSDAEAKSGVRFSIGWTTTRQEVDYVVKVVPTVVKQLRTKS